MALDSDKLEKPFSKLAKSLKKLPKQPSPKQVHNIRTRTRRVEAALHALLIDKKQIGQRSTKAMAGQCDQHRFAAVRRVSELAEAQCGKHSSLSSESERTAYVLELSSERGDLIDQLGEVKDTIGEWHDWIELANIAEQVLQHSDRCDLLEEIQAGAKERFENALTLANRLREQYFCGAAVEEQACGVIAISEGASAEGKRRISCVGEAMKRESLRR